MFMFILSSRYIDTLASSLNQYFSSHRLFTASKEACPLSVDATGEAHVYFFIPRQSFGTEALNHLNTGFYMGY